VSDRVVIMERGRLIAQGPINQLLAGDRSLFQVTVRGDGATVIARLQQISWIKGVSAELGLPDLEHGHTTNLKVQVTDPQLAAAELLRLVLADDSIVVTQFARSSYDLEDVFVSLVEGENSNAK
jgi:ABC-2 type transport system ATP-binding protein